MSSTSGPSSLNSATTRFARRRFAPTTPSASAGAAARTIDGARGAAGAQPGHATRQRREHARPSETRAPDRTRATTRARSPASGRRCRRSRAGRPPSPAPACARARLPPSPPAATSPIATRTSDGTHSAVSSTTATAPASGAAARRRADLVELAVAVARLERRQRGGRVSLDDAGRSAPTSRPRPRLSWAAVAGVDQRHVLGADARVAIAAHRERRRQLLRDEAVDRGAEQQRLGALAWIRGRRGPGRPRGRCDQSDSQNADGRETDRAPRHRTSKPQSAGLAPRGCRRGRGRPKALI